MKKYKIEQVLEAEQNFEQFYNGIDPKPEDEELPPGYENEADYKFYGDDVDFMKFHKRTKANMQRGL